MAKEIEITLNDYARLMLLPEGKEKLDAQIASNHLANYKSRQNSIARDASSELRASESQELRKISPSRYEEIKKAQLRQLYTAYTERHHGLMWIEPNEVSEDAVRRVVGDKGGQLINMGAMLLNHDDIQSVNYIANRSNEEGYQKRFSTYNLSIAVDEIVALRDIVAKEFGLTYPDTTISSITRSTDIGSMVYERYSRPEYAKEYDRETLKRIIERSKVPVEKRNRKTIIDRLLGREKEVNKGDKTYKVYEGEEK